MYSNQDRIAAYRNASSEMAELYSSTETSDVLYSVRNKHSIPPGKLAHIVGDVILGFYPKIALPKLLTERLHISKEVLKSVIIGLEPLLAKIPGATIDELLKGEVGDENTSSPQNPTSQVLLPTQPVLTREELMKALESKRTMASDVAAVSKKPEETAEKPVVGYGGDDERSS